LRLRRTVMLEGMQLLARHLGHAPKEWFLTYAIELLALPDRERRVGDLNEHLSETLALVTPWLHPAELPALKKALNNLLCK
jgi:hypothetical protein